MSLDGLQAMLPDRYEVERELGRGGMAIVCLAVDRKHDRPVAVKVLLPDLAAGIASDRFLREIRIAANLSHPHIVPLHDSGLAGNRPFYVMPYVEGESLRERLEREGELPVDEALRIARDVGDALACAHRHGVVHRDIKPGNILLTEGGAVVTDFGIALAVSQAAEEHLTQTGQSVGTTGYMSPEQCSGDVDVDERSDQYSLACVLYETLAGEPPYTGRNARAILGKQLSQPVPSITALRAGVSPELESVLRRALARSPADRYASMGAFNDALERVGGPAVSGWDTPPGQRRPWARLRPATAWTAAAGAVLLAGGWWLLPTGSGWNPGGGEETETAVEVDPSRYAIFPFEDRAGDGVELDEEGRLHDALARWEGISIADAFQLRDAMERTGATDLGTDEAAAVARGVGAGWFLLGRQGFVGDSIRVEVSLFEAGARGANRVAGYAVRLPRSLAGADSAFMHLAERLLFEDSPPASAFEGGTRSVPARRAFGYGMEAVKSWDLARADSGFAQAAAHDPEYAEAHLWAALVGAWEGKDPAAWRLPAEQARMRRARLTVRDAEIADALVLQADGEYGEACRRWEGLTRRHPNDFLAWYGLALCLRLDGAVVPDPSSPSGWAFRSSYHRAIEAYERAFAKLPSVLESFGSDSYRSLRALFSLSGTALREGQALLPDTTRFFSFPTWAGDSLAFTPYPGGPSFMGLATADARDMDRGVRLLRQKFKDVAVAWATISPRSPRAREAMAYGMMMLGESAAIDTLLRGRELARHPDDQLELAASEVWVRLALSLPHDSDGLERLHFLADSLLSGAPALESRPRLGAALAALLGRASEASTFARRLPPERGSALPPQTQAAAQALLMFAALGGPSDSLRRLEAEVRSAIERIAPVEARSAERAAWLVRPATLAFPTYRFPATDELAFDWLIAAQQAMRAGDTSVVRQRLQSQGTTRQIPAPYGRALDTLLPETTLLVGIADLEEAQDWIAPTLTALPEIEIHQLSSPEGAAALVRAAVLRAEIGAGLGTPDDARPWARAVTILWSDAEPFLQPTVERMRRLADEGRVAASRP